MSQQGRWIPSLQQLCSDVFEDINTMAANHSHGDPLNRSSSSGQARALYQGQDSLQPDLSWEKTERQMFQEISDTLDGHGGEGGS